MKGVEPLIAAIFIIIISITGIAIVLESSQPSVSRLQEISLLNEAKKILTQIDNAVRAVGEEGEGSTRVLQLSVSDGNYVIDTDKDVVTFSMDSKSQVVGRGVTQVEGDVNIYGGLNHIVMNVSYSTVNITGGGSFGRGIHSLIIRNDGYDVVNQKQIISISLVPPLIIPVAFMNQYNQFGDPYIAKGGTYSGYASYLNKLGEGLTYDVPEAIEILGGTFSYSQSQTANITGTNTTPAENTVSIDNVNYNVTSTPGQKAGTFVNQYNQTQTAVIVGTNSTSPNNLNSIDGYTYNVTEFAIPQTNQSSDLEPGTIRDRVIGAPTLTGNKTPSSWGKNVNNWFNQSNITLSDNKWTYAFTQNAGEDWYNFGFNIPAGSVIYGIRGIVEYSSNTTSATQCILNISNNNGTSYSPMAVLSSSSATDANTTLGTYSSLWGLTWNPSNINSAGGLMIETNKTQSQGARMFRIDTLTLEVNYSPPVTDLNTTYTTYNNVRSGNFLIINNISVTVNVSSYNNTGSVGKSSNPDLWLEVWNGTIWSVVGNMSVRGIGNFTTYVPNQDNIYLNWSGSSTQRNIRIMGRYFDANDTTYDEINWTAVWVTLNYSNYSRAEIEHNATGISWYGNLNSINVSVNFTTNVTSVFNLTIYNFNTGVWNYSVCQSGTATANTWYNWWCNVTTNPSYYNSSNGVIRLRLNGTNHTGVASIREDYVQYYANYTIPTNTYANISVEHNSSAISWNPSTLAKINVTTLLKTNITTGIAFNLYIYNFNTQGWEQCGSPTSIGTSYVKMECGITSNPSSYISGNIRVRINSSNVSTHQMMEDYLVYQITSLSTYRVEVWHNSSQIADGSISFINATINFTTNVTDVYSLQIYDWLNSQWSSSNCDSGNVLANTPTRWWCNETSNAMNYNSSDRKVRIRIGSTADTDNGLLKEDYVQYFIGYAQ